VFAALLIAFSVVLFSVVLKVPMPAFTLPRFRPLARGGAMLSDLALGFSVALTFTNLGLCLLGCLIGR
jgi:hypothetical protein